MNARRYISRIMVILLAGCSFGACSKNDDAAQIYYSEVRSVDKLALAQMTISKMATIDDIHLEDAEGARQTAAALLDAVKIGNRKAAYSYDTYLRAFIDLSTLTPEDVKVDETSRTITLTLPPVQTEYLGRDMEIREDHYRVTGMRSDIDARERAAIKEQMNTVLKAEVEEKPEFRNRLIGQAKTKASAYFSSLLGRDGYNVNVKFREGN